ncbi:MAG: DUF3782 domain-containing protein, partial [Caldilineaceae bacterium]
SHDGVHERIMSENLLTPELIEEIEEYILKRLPQVLEQDPNFATLIEGMLAEKFPRRDEFARMLDELQEHRRDTRQEFKQADERLSSIEQEVQEHRRETRAEFKLVDERLSSVEQEIQEHRRETHQRFEQVDQRFEQVDQRFEQVDQRFEQVDQRFEQVDQRFDRLETEMRTGFDNVQRSIDRLGSRWGIRNEAVFRQTMRELLENSFGATVEERHIRGEQFDCVIINGQHILVEITASAGQRMLERLERKRKLYTDETGIAPTRFLLVVGAIHSRRAEQLRQAGFEVIEPEDQNED